MKKLIVIAILFFTCAFSESKGNSLPADPYSAASYYKPVGFSFQLFYDRLSPYGIWVDYPSYGYVWVPSAGPGFTPYATRGHWEYTFDYGWVWVSDYEWGWAPFHYGRWNYDNYYGWIWVPGYDWAPAWVTWGYYDNYYGWAPLGPGIGYSTGYRPPVDHWCFVPRDHVNSTTIINYRVNNTTINQNNIRVINESRTYNDTKYFSGPRVDEVQKATGQRIAPKALTDAKAPTAAQVNSKQITLYRPSITKSSEGKAAPAKVERLENLKRVNPTGNTNQKQLQGSSSKPAMEKQPRQATPAQGDKPVIRSREAQPAREKRIEQAQPVQREKPQIEPADPKPVYREPRRVEPAPPAPEKPQMEMPRQAEPRPIDPRMQPQPREPRMEIPPAEPIRPQMDRTPMEPARPMTPPPSSRPQMGSPSPKPSMGGRPRSSSEQNMSAPPQQATIMPPLRNLRPKTRAPGR